MGSIHLMSSDLVGRIAAGEVVERPASVVKELVENSIDAGAHAIRILIEQGGQRLIQVIDDGCGMDRADALLCLETHATSKISGTGDVGHIATLGFRGEAVPSIASISRFSLQTRRQEDAAGTEVLVDFGAIREVRDCGCAAGTNIRVGQLFANLPARRKFLRGPDTEDGYIEEMVRMEALARPSVAFTLTINGREHLRTVATERLADRAVAVLGKEMFAAMLPVDYEEGGVRVRGFITTPGFTRTTRREQRIVVNGRVASADTVFFALRDAYENLVMKGRYPGALLYIDLAPDRVDVNVHPTKREVRFREPREVGEIVGGAIRRALRTMPGGPPMEPAGTSAVDVTPSAPPAVQPELPLPGLPVNHQPSLPLDLPPLVTQRPGSLGDYSRKFAGANPAIPPPFPSGGTADVNPAIPPPFPSGRPGGEEQGGDACAGGGASETRVPPPPFSQTNAPALSPLRSGLRNMRLIGRLGTAYALAEGENGLVVVSLRAAHERILFERLLHEMSRGPALRQQLLLPATINLTPDDSRFLRNVLPHFSQLGFQIEPFGGNSYIVSAVPSSFPDQDIGQVVRDIIDDLRGNRVTARQSALHLAETACRHAISAHEQLTDAQVAALLQDLAQTDMPYASPAGTPTMVLITSSELEKRFKG
ncbi:MAG: DNA mismatch repair endonuclease MutL [Victivallales bacterium]|nr:DNA mismatch repair endonuclease MutL [Victivallales bacterium]